MAVGEWPSGSPLTVTAILTVHEITAVILRMQFFVGDFDIEKDACGAPRMASKKRRYCAKPGDLIFSGCGLGI
jgi:hypothetical protein